MEFESPDVEREFPGLYASDAGKKSNDSDFSDETHERISKKDLLIGKRKDKKDKKDRGYATLEGESSPEEEADVKSPSKTKKSKPFKFPSKKEKREKSREKDGKDKESDKDKKKDDKEKKKDKDKLKVKSKEKKKPKHGDDILEVAEDLPIFGVPLTVAVERSKCHDGVDIPLIVRNCIDHVQETGLTAENLYKVSGIKSRVQQVRKMYNNHEPVSLKDFDLPVATSLLKQFLRELPEPVLTTDLVSKFEEAGAMKEVTARGAKLRELLELLPSCNRALLGWLLKHLDDVAAHEKYNKMNAQSISVTISPLLQISQRLLTALLCHVSELYPNLILTKYIPPLSSTSPTLPDTVEGLSEELAKQESLLGQIHREMYQGLTGKDREEQLWAVSRIITQLKRKLRALEKNYGQRSLDDTDSSLRLDDHSMTLSKEEGTPKKGEESPWTPLEEGPPQSVEPTIKVPVEDNGPWAPSDEGPRKLGHEAWSSLDDVRKKQHSADDAWNSLDRRSPRQTSVDIPLWNSEDGKRRGSFTPASDNPSPLPLSQIRPGKVMTAESLEVQDINREATEKAEKKQRAVIETEELMLAISRLREELEAERVEVNRIRSRIHALGGIPHTWCSLSDSSDEENSPPPNVNLNGLWKRKLELKEETKKLQAQKNCLIESISAESEACIDLRIQIKLLQLNRNLC
uniref:Rho-GAP domain-containing protein n=1 Tax=Riptortus pedestris TaxID=329032 RepID=R4WJ16_RIPPE|nr:conserved hypothetical protein [Riptortus pedestris]